MTDTARNSHASRHNLPLPVFSRGRWLWPLIIGAAGFAIIYPFDGPLAAAASQFSKSLGGDLRREWIAWQQYGQATALVVTALLIWLLDPARRKRLFDLLLTAILAEAISLAGKMLVGRPRPRPEFGDPRTFLGPFGEYPIRINGAWKLVHAWDTRAGANTALWSMPSSHTLFAAALTVFFATLYPKIRWVAYALLVIVGTGRVLFDAHWPSDVVVGAAMGWAAAAWAVGGSVGVRLAARFTRPEIANRGG